MENWRWMTAEALGQGIASAQIDPVTLVKTFLNAIEAHPEADRIYARTTPERAIAEAEAAKERASSGMRRSALDGVPISWKDLFDTSGVATEAGTALLQGRTPERDAQVLENATRAGLVCLGKTHMSEIAFSGLGLNPITATPPNKNDIDAVPGGSSSGAAASVAFGLAAAAIGSDTGGSVRIPSAWNDLVGFKTTIGALSVKGTVPLCETFDTVGPLCRSVSDANLLLAILGNSDVCDLTNSDVSGMHFAILDTIVFQDMRDSPADAFRAAVTRIKAAGAEITHIEVPELTEAYDFAGPLYTADAWSFWRPYVQAAPQKMFAQILERVRAGADVKAADYLAHWTRLREIRAIYAAKTAGFDAVLMPTAPILPPNAEKLMTDNEYYVRENLLALRNTRVANLMGTCALTLPTGAPSCGIMLNAAAGEDVRLLRIGAAVESALA